MVDQAIGMNFRELRIGMSVRRISRVNVGFGVTRQMVDGTCVKGNAWAR